MKLVYIAGPYRAETVWEVEQNVRRAEKVAYQVAQCGALPVCPHANMRPYFQGCREDQFWLEGYLELVRRCDGFMPIEGWRESTGSTSEQEEAFKGGLRVFLEGDYAALEEWVGIDEREILRIGGRDWGKTAGPVAVKVRDVQIEVKRTAGGAEVTASVNGGPTATAYPDDPATAIAPFPPTPIEQPSLTPSRNDLRDMRKAAGLSIGDLARKTGWPTFYLSGLERGAEQPDETALKVWAQACAPVSQAERTPEVLRDMWTGEPYLADDPRHLPLCPSCHKPTDELRSGLCPACSEASADISKDEVKGCKEALPLQGRQGWVSGAVNLDNHFGDPPDPRSPSDSDEADELIGTGVIQDFPTRPCPKCSQPIPLVLEKPEQGFVAWCTAQGCEGMIEYHRGRWVSDIGTADDADTDTDTDTEDQS